MAGQERLENVNPEVFGKAGDRPVLPEELDDDVTDEIDAREVFDLIKDINDPEHPLSLEELNVIKQAHIQLDNDRNLLTVRFTPTIPHCSMATLIGLSIRVRLLRVLPERFKVDIQIEPGTHSSETAINKQLADKERVAAALENSNLIQVVNNCLSTKS